MPDANGRIRPISVPRVPWLERCKRTGLTKPECSCKDCAAEQIARRNDGKAA